MPSQRIEVAWIQFQAPTRHQKRTRHPTRRQTHHTLTRGEGLSKQGSGGHYLLAEGFSGAGCTSALACAFALTLSMMGSAAYELCCGARVSISPDTIIGCSTGCAVGSAASTNLRRFSFSLMSTPGAAAELIRRRAHHAQS